MKYVKTIVEAIFVKRPNRFNAHVILDDEEIVVHVPNTGRCAELLVNGAKVFLRQENNPNRKTKYDLIAVIKDGKFISMDSQIPNKVVYEALINKRVEKLKDYNEVLKEKTFGKSRFDFKLKNHSGHEYFLEVKGVTLEENGFARFPDAKTERGARHIKELIEAKKCGYGAGIMFLIQMKEVTKFSPNDERDPSFGIALREAIKNDVDVFVYNCICDNEGIELYKPIKLEI